MGLLILHKEGISGEMNKKLESQHWGQENHRSPTLYLYSFLTQHLVNLPGYIKCISLEAVDVT